MKQTSLLTVLTDSLLIPTTRFCTNLPQRIYDKLSQHMGAQFAITADSQT